MNHRHSFVVLFALLALGPGIRAAAAGSSQVQNNAVAPGLDWRSGQSLSPALALRHLDPTRLVGIGNERSHPARPVRLANYHPDARGSEKIANRRLHPGGPVSLLGGAPADEPIHYLVRLAAPALVEVWQTLARQGQELSPPQRQALQVALSQGQAELAREIESRGVPIVGAYQASLNGLQVLATPQQARLIAHLPGVAKVEPVPSLVTTIDRAVDHVGAPRVWQDLGWDGSGVTIAIIDSGIDYDHLAFGGSGSPEAWLTNNPRVVEPGTFPTAKVIGGYDFAGEVYSDSCPPEAPPEECSRIPTPDPDPLDGPGGHGSHIAGIAAGMAAENLPPGTAPGARLLAA